MSRFALRIRNAKQVVQVCCEKESVLRGARSDLCVIDNGSLVVDLEGRLVTVAAEEELRTQSWYQEATFDLDFDAAGKCVLPGFVDAHTHPVWAGDRVHEFELKLNGATYMDVHKAGGGIGFTVRHTRAATKDVLLDLLLSRLKRMLAQGTTLIEAKSGYGLDVDSEMKQLEVLHEAQKLQPVSISSTFLGAHSVPAGSSAADATRDIVEVQLPRLADLREKGTISPRSIDVFFEKGVFDLVQTRTILEAGKKLGLMINFHGDELNPNGAGELGAEIGAHAISHLEEVSEEGIHSMSNRGVIAILLPSTAYVLRIKPPPARRLLDAGVAVALGSDFNPNAHCLSLPLIMNLACVLMHLTPAEAVVAATLNAAASLGMSDMHGSLEVGKWGNLVVLDAPDWRHILYQMADPPIECVFVKGRCAYRCPSQSKK